MILSQRGKAAANQPLRADLDAFYEALEDKYDAKDNTNGKFTLTIAENALCWAELRGKFRDIQTRYEKPDWVASYTSLLGAPELREAATAFLQQHFSGVPLSPERLGVAASAAAIIEMHSLLLCSPGPVATAPGPAAASTGTAVGGQAQGSLSPAEIADLPPRPSRDTPFVAPCGDTPFVDPGSPGAAQPGVDDIAMEQPGSAPDTTHGASTPADPAYPVFTGGSADNVSYGVDLDDDVNMDAPSPDPLAPPSVPPSPLTPAEPETIDPVDGDIGGTSEGPLASESGYGTPAVTQQAEQEHSAALTAPTGPPSVPRSSLPVPLPPPSAPPPAGSASGSVPPPPPPPTTVVCGICGEGHHTSRCKREAREMTQAGHAYLACSHCGGIHSSEHCPYRYGCRYCGSTSHETSACTGAAGSGEAMPQAQPDVPAANSPPAPPAPASGGATVGVLYHSVTDLYNATMHGTVIDVDHIAHSVYLQLVQWMQMLQQKCAARIQRDRESQDRDTERHTRRWLQRNTDGWNYRETCGAKGQSEKQRLNHCYRWNPNLPGAQPPWKTQAEIEADDLQREEKRISDRLAAAIKKWKRFESANGFAADLHYGMSHEARQYHGHRSTAELPNYFDEGRCPRCFADTHNNERACPLQIGGNALGPPVVARANSMPGTAESRLRATGGGFGRTPHC